MFGPCVKHDKSSPLSLLLPVPPSYHPPSLLRPGRHPGGVEKRLFYEGQDVVDTDAMLHLRKHDRPVAAHELGVPPHDVEGRADHLGEVGFVDAQDVALGDPRPALAWHLVAARHVNHVDREVRQLAGKVGGQVVAAGFCTDTGGASASETGGGPRQEQWHEKRA